MLRSTCKICFGLKRETNENTFVRLKETTLIKKKVDSLKIPQQNIRLLRKIWKSLHSVWSLYRKIWPFFAIRVNPIVRSLYAFWKGHSIGGWTLLPSHRISLRNWKKCYRKMEISKPEDSSASGWEIGRLALLELCNTWECFRLALRQSNYD